VKSAALETDRAAPRCVYSASCVLVPGDVAVSDVQNGCAI